MKIAWFTPLSRLTGIGEFSQILTKHLSHRCDVDLWVTSENNPRPTTLKTFNYGLNPELLNNLPSYDAIVYNMGNSITFHQSIYDVAQRYPGIVILHDRIMHHFFIHYFLEKTNNKELYASLMRQYYGEEAGHVAWESVNGQRELLWCDPVAISEYPFFEPAIATAKGVIVHNNNYLCEIQEKWLGPAKLLPFPCYFPCDELPNKPLFNTITDKVRLVSLGHIVPTKQIDKVLKCIAANKALSERVHYSIIGSYDINDPYVQELFAFIKKHGLEDSVTFTGLVDDAELALLLREFDIALNMRFPITEGASASLMRLMAAGLPVIVYDSGHYSELPAECVVKIDENDPDSLSKALNKLIDDAVFQKQISENAKSLCLERSPQKYVDHLLAFINESYRWQPILDLCQRYSGLLGELSCDNSPVLIEELSRLIAQISPG